MLNSAFALCSSLTFRFVKAYIGPEYFFVLLCSSNKIKVLSGRGGAKHYEKMLIPHI